MKSIKFLFWALASFFLGVCIYTLWFLPGNSEDNESKTLDRSKKRIQALLADADQKLPKDTSVEFDSLIAPVLEKRYEILKARDLFARYEVFQKDSLSLKPQTTTTVVSKPVTRQEKSPALFLYKGTLQLGGKNVVILQEEKEKQSFFVGIGDEIRLSQGDPRYELIDITKDEVILLKKSLDKEEKVVIPKKTK